MVVAVRSRDQAEIVVLVGNLLFIGNRARDFQRLSVQPLRFRQVLPGAGNQAEIAEIASNGGFVLEFPIARQGSPIEPFRGVEIAGSERPWLYTASVHGLTRCEIPLLDEGQVPTTFTVRLGFVAEVGGAPGQDVFDIKLQGAEVLAGFDAWALAGAPNKAVIREFRGVKVADKLLLELVPGTSANGRALATAASFIEVIREDAR